MATTGSDARGAAQLPALPDRLPLVIGVTGHRNVRAQDVTRLEEKVAEVIAQIRQRYLRDNRETPLILLSPLAEGADRIVARVALKAGVRLIAPLPMPVEDYRRDFEPGLKPGAATEFDELLRHAIATPVVPLCRGVSLDEVRTNPAKRALQYRAVGVFLVQHCDVLIALWDGNEADAAVGGTAEIVKFKREGMPLTLTGSAHASLDGSEIGPVIHVVTPRDRADSFATEVLVEPWGDAVIARHRGGKFARACRWLAESAANLVWLEPHEGALEPAQRAELTAWECFDSLVKLTCSFNSDAARLFASPEGHADVARNIGYLLTDPDTGKLDERTKTYACARTPQWWNLYGAADALAQRGQRSFRSDWFLIFVLGFTAFVAFALVMHLGIEQHEWLLHHGLGEFRLLSLYSALMLGLVYVIVRARYRGDQDRFLDYRALAEAMRVALYWNLIGIGRSEVSTGGDLAGRPSSNILMTSYPLKQPNELTWVKTCLRKLDWLRETETVAAAMLDPLAYGIARRYWVYGQFKYFSKQGRRHDRRAERFEGGSIVLLVITAFIVGPALFMSEFIPRLAVIRSVNWFLVPAIAILPGLAAALASYSERLALNAQARQYDRMRALFGRAHELLPAAPDSASAPLISSLFLELGTEAMKENAEWVAIYRQRPMRPLQ